MAIWLALDLDVLQKERVLMLNGSNPALAIPKRYSSGKNLPRKERHGTALQKGIPDSNVEKGLRRLDL